MIEKKTKKNFSAVVYQGKTQFFVMKRSLNHVVAGNALAQVQRVHKLVDLWDINFCTRRFWQILINQFLENPSVWCC